MAFADVCNLDDPTSRRRIAGTTVRIETPAGAGFGDAWRRAPERVEADVLGGKVSPEASRRDYGVVVDHGVLDRKATSALRKRRKTQE